MQPNDKLEKKLKEIEGERDRDFSLTCLVTHQRQFSLGFYENFMHTVKMNIKLKIGMISSQRLKIYQKPFLSSINRFFSSVSPQKKWKLFRQQRE